jgi:hypothetical protein
VFLVSLSNIPSSMMQNMESPFHVKIFPFLFGVEAKFGLRRGDILPLQKKNQCVGPNLLVVI